MIDKRKGSALYDIISGARKDPAALATRFALDNMSRIYRRGWRSRMKKLEARGKDALDAPVVSIGNITLGGTGKTPVCRHLAELLEERGKKVGIATRGYGREGAGTEVLDPSRKNIDWHQCGDEPLLYLRGARNTTVAVEVDRFVAGSKLTGEYGCDVVLLDDGFQFITLHRDVNIVVFDPLYPLGFEKLVPAGLLREPLESLARATHFWIAKADVMPGEVRAGLLQRLERDFPGAPVIQSRYAPVGLAELEGGELLPVDRLKSRKAMCVSAVGAPEPFERLVGELAGVEPLAFRFTDHHPFGEGDLQQVEDEAIKSRADVIVTTEKDAVRIPGFFTPSCRWFALVVKIEIMSGGEHVEEILDICD